MNPKDFPNLVTFQPVTSFSKTPTFTAPWPTFTPLVKFPTAFGNDVTKTNKVYERSNLHVRDLGDLLFGNPVTGTNQLERTLKDNGLDNLVMVPILNRIAGAGLMVKERTIDPIAQGKPLTAGVNMLESLGYTADTLSNIVKSFLPITGGGTWDDFLDSMGWRAGIDRKQYQADTGNLLTDILVEVLVDPTTWITMGGKAIATATKETATEATETALRNTVKKRLLKEVSEEIAEETAENIMKQIPKKTIENLTEALSKNVGMEDSKLLESLQDMLHANNKYFTKDLLKNINKSDEAYKEISKLVKGNNAVLSALEQPDYQRMLMNIRFSDGYKWFNAGNKLLSISNKIDNALLLAGLQLTTAGPSLFYLNKKLGVSKQISSLWNHRINKLKQVNAQDVLKDKKGLIKRMNKYTTDLYATVYSTKQLANFSKSKTDYVYKTAVNMYTNVLNTVKTVDASIDLVDDKFYKRLIQKFPELDKIDANELNVFLQPAKRESIEKWHNVQYINALEKELTGLKEVNVKDIDWVKRTMNMLEQHYINTFGGNGTEIIDALRNYSSLDARTKEYIDKILEASGLRSIKDKQLLADAIVAFHRGDDAKVQDKFFKLFRKSRLGEYYDAVSVPRYVKELYDDAQNIFKTISTKYSKDSKKLEDILNDIENPLHKIFSANADKAYKEKVINALDQITEYETLKADYNILDLELTTIFANYKIDDELIDDWANNLDIAFQIDAYADTGTSLQDLLEEARKMLKDEDDIQNQSEWITNSLESLRNRVHSYIKQYETIIERGSDLSRISHVTHNDIEILKELEDLLTKPKTTRIVTNARELLQSNDAFYQLIVSHSGRMRIMNRELMQTDLFKILTEDKINGVKLRNDLQRTIIKLKEIGTVDADKYAEDIGAVLGAIDATLNTNRLLQTDVEFIPIPKDVKDFIEGMMINILVDPKGYANRSIDSMLNGDALDDIMYQFMNQVSKHTHDIMLDYFTSNKLDLIDTKKVNELTDQLNILNRKAMDLDDEIEASIYFKEQVLIKDKQKQLNKLMEQIESIEDQIERTHLSTFLGDSNAPEIMISNWQTELERVVRNAFKEYMVSTLEIQKDLDIALKFYNEFDQRLVHIMTGLGYDLITINGLVRSVDLNTEDSVTKFISLIAHKTVSDINKLTDTERASLIKEISYDEVNSLSKQIVEECDLPLATAVTNAFKEIDVLDSQLAYMSQDYIPRTAGKYYSQTNKAVTEAKNVIAFATVQDFNKVIRDKTVWLNAYAWSTANGYLGVKRLDNYTFKGVKSLKYKMLKYSDIAEDVTSDLTIITFINKYNDAYKYAKQFDTPNMRVIDCYRQLLIKFYSENDFLFAPKDPMFYFSLADDTDIIAWYNTTLDSTFSKECATKFTQYVDAYKQANNTNRKLMEQADKQAITYLDLTEKLNQSGIWSEDTLNKIIENAPSNTGTWIVDATERKLKEFMKDPESLAKHQAAFNKFINNNVRQLNELKTLVSLNSNKTTLREMFNIDAKLKLNNLKREQPTLYKFLRANKLDLDDTVGSYTVQRFLKQEREKAFAYNIVNMNAKQLRTYIDKNTQGFMIYISDKITDAFKFTEEELKEAGIIVQEIPDLPNGFFIRRTSLDTTNNQYVWKVPKWNMPSIQSLYTKTFKKTSSVFYWDTMYIPDQLFTGDMMDSSLYDALFNNKKLAKLIGDTEVQKTYLKFDKNGHNSFFTKDVSRPNGVIVGPNGSYNTLVDYLRRSDTSLVSLNYKSPCLDKSSHIGITQALLRQDAEQKYLQMFFNDDFTITGKFWNKILSTASDTELGSLFARNKNVAVVLRENKKGLPEVFKLTITGRTTLNTAKDLGAIIVPHEVYRNMVLTVNEHKVSNRLMQLYRRFFVQTFKTIYLSNPGFLFRNGVDSLVYKNAATTEGTWSILDNFKYEHRAAKLLELHNNVTKDAINIAKGRTLNRKTINAALRKYTAQEQAQYRLVDIFLNSHASGGYTKALREYLLEYNMKDLVFDGTKFEEFWVNRVVNNPYSEFIQDINSQIEQTARLGLFLNLVDNGGDVTSAISKVVDTHFDYDLFANKFNLIEEIFWFSTFPLNNIAYYINDGLLKNPELLKLQLDLTEQSWNSGDYTWDKVRSSNYLTYHSLAGNIRLYMLGNDVNDPTARVVLKTGSSVYDFFETMFLPITSAKERLNPILAVLLGTVPAKTELDPTSTVRSRIKQVLQGNPIPSVISILNNQKRNYKYRTNYYRKAGTWTNYPKKIKQPNSRARHNYRLVTNRYYFGKNLPKHYKVTAPYVTSIEPYWYNGRSTQAKRMLYRIRHKKSELYR